MKNSLYFNGGIFILGEKYNQCIKFVPSQVLLRISRYLNSSKVAFVHIRFIHFIVNFTSKEKNNKILTSIINIHAKYMGMKYSHA